MLCGSIEGINYSFGDFLMFRNASITIKVGTSKSEDFETTWSFLGTLHLNFRLVEEALLQLYLGARLIYIRDWLVWTLTSLPFW
jgi:hypothetical protein